MTRQFHWRRFRDGKYVQWSLTEKATDGHPPGLQVAVVNYRPEAQAQEARWKVSMNFAGRSNWAFLGSTLAAKRYAQRWLREKVHEWDDCEIVEAETAP